MTMTRTIHEPLTKRPPTLAPEIDQNPVGLRVAVCKVGEVVNVRESRWDLSGNPPNLVATTIYWVSGQTYTGVNYKTKNYGSSNQFRAVWHQIKGSDPETYDWHYVADILLDVSGPVPADMNNPFDSGSDEICVIRRAEGAKTIKAYDKKSTGANVTHQITDNTPYWASCNDWTTTNWTALFYDGIWHFIQGASLDRAEVKPTLWSDLIDSSEQPPGQPWSDGDQQADVEGNPDDPIPDNGPHGEKNPQVWKIACTDPDGVNVRDDASTSGGIVGAIAMDGPPYWAIKGNPEGVWADVFYENDWYYVNKEFIRFSTTSYKKKGPPKG